jgi:hypothetical protein
VGSNPTLSAEVDRCATAFVERPGAVCNPLLERPDIVGTDLGGIAERVTEIDR